MEKDALLALELDIDVVEVIQEVYGGRLVVESLEKDVPFSGATAGLTIAAFCACIHVGEAFKFIAKLTPMSKDQNALFLLLGKIDEVELPFDCVERKEVRTVRPPSVIAAVVAMTSSEGTSAYLLFRHPDIDRQQAVLLAKVVALEANEHARRLDEEILAKN